MVPPRTRYSYSQVSELLPLGLQSYYLRTFVLTMCYLSSDDYSGGYVDGKIRETRTLDQYLPIFANINIILSLEAHRG